MACDIKVGWAFINILTLILTLQQCVLGLSQQVPCFFIFGDSLSDSGNNNVLATLTKANYPPYGIDFPIGLTGRFCNGETRVDIIAKFLGFVNYIPPFAMATSDILKGLNYASSGLGILDDTGGNQGEHIYLNQQLHNHKVTIKGIVAKLGTVDSATQYLNKCLYSVGMGTDDYANNYFSPLFSLKSLLYDLEKYTQILLHQYSKQLRTLHDLGARKIVVFGLGRLGCTPYTINVFPVNITGCVENLNYAAKLFNKKLKSLVDQLNINLTDAKFIYVNIYGMMSSDFLLSAGFKVLDGSCCPVLNATVMCFPFATPCQNRSEYVYWDAFHPSQAMNQIIAQRSYKAVHPSDAHPFDVSQLVKLP